MTRRWTLRGPALSGRRGPDCPNAPRAWGGGRCWRVTERQVSVLQLSNAGRTVEEVAGLLALEVSSVRRYLQQAYERLHARSKVEALFLARRAGLIRDE